MELIDRYLQAVKFWLPKTQKLDIIAELSEDLHSQMEEQQADLGRPLNESEVEVLLKKFGPPMLVAQRYQPQRYLIGPQMFPIYWFILRLQWMYFFIPWFIFGVGLDIFVAANGNPRYLPLSGLLAHFWLAAILNLSIMTLAFALIDRYQPQGIWGRWEPRRLPQVRDLNRIPRSSSIGEVGWYAILFFWWVNVFHLPSIAGMEITASGFISRVLYWPILAGLLLQSVVAGMNVLKPWWTPARAAVRAFVDSLGLFVVSTLLVIAVTGGSLVVVQAEKLSPAEKASVQSAITWGWVAILLVWAEIGFLVRLIQDVRRALGRQPIRNWALQLIAGD